MQPIYASASEVLSRWVFRALDAILEEVDHLHNVSTRFEGTGVDDHHNKIAHFYKRPPHNSRPFCATENTFRAVHGVGEDSRWAGLTLRVPSGYLPFGSPFCFFVWSELTSFVSRLVASLESAAL